MCLYLKIKKIRLKKNMIPPTWLLFWHRIDAWKHALILRSASETLIHTTTNTEKRSHCKSWHIIASQIMSTTKPFNY